MILKISGIHGSWQPNDLQHFLEPFARIYSVRIVRDLITDKSTRMAFVEVRAEADAHRLIAAFHGKSFVSRQIIKVLIYQPGTATSAKSLLENAR